MKLKFKVLALAAPIALVGSAVAAGPALADPAGGGLITLVCGHQSYQVTLGGNGNWIPAHDSNSNTVWQPVAFGASQGAALDASNPERILASFSDPSFIPKGGQRVGQGSVSCVYSGQDGPVYDQELGAMVIYTFSREVWLKAKAG
jgi:hypothetical protein